MRSLIAISVSCIALAATPAQAGDGAWYVGGDFGAMIVEDIDLSFTGSPNDAVTLNHDYGYDAALFTGYDLGGFRIEAEVAYKKADLDEFENTLPLPSSSGPHPVGVHPDSFGSTTALSFMINGMLDFGDDDGISGFLGGGVGVARVNFNSLRAFENTGEFIDDSDTRFAWQIVAGVRTAISQNVDVHARYRFFNVSGLDVQGFGGTEDFEGRFRSHSILGGITFNFGQPQ